MMNNKANGTSYMRNLKRRIASYGCKVTIDENITLFSVYGRYKGICQSCGIKTVRGLHPQVPESATVEHLVPLHKGGHHVWSNVTLMCHKCNIESNRKFHNMKKKLTIFQRFVKWLKGLKHEKSKRGV